MRRGKTGSAPAGLDGNLKPLQRFWCSSCRSSFTCPRKTTRAGARFADNVVEEAVRIYVQGLSSYRVLAAMLEHRLGVSVSRFTLNAGCSSSERAPRHR
jgi:transposase-like protein